MNSYPLTIFWLRILALVAVEIGVVVLLFALAQRRCRTAAWRKILCEAALITAGVLAFSELSGAGRSFMAVFVRPEKGPWAMFPTGGGSGPEAPANQPQLSPQFRSKVFEQLARNQPQASDSSITRHGTLVTSHELPLATRHSAITDSTVIFSFGIILGIGIAFVAGRACLGRIVLIFLGWRGKAFAESELLERIQLLARRFGFSRSVRIIESPRLVSPIAFGFMRPTIGLPSTFSAKFPAAKQDAMLTHELAHLAAHDPLWYLLADLVAAVLWWHPGVWWLRRQLQLSSELAADEASLMTPQGPRVLAECLVEMGAQLAKPAPGHVRVAGFRSDLGCRVQRLMRLEGAQWTPISGSRAVLAKSIGPIAIAGILILCTAWAVPRELTKGDSMKTMKKRWQRALATFATLAAIQTPTLVNGQDNPAPGVSPRPAEGGARANALPGAQNPPSAEFARRYGLAVGPTTAAANPVAPQGMPGTPPRGGRLEAKLREIVMDEVKLDGLPLSEVLNFLSDESRKRDPEKKGINFLLNPNAPQNQGPSTAAVDPTTGLPIASPVASVDISSVTVKFNIPLRHVTMADVLDAIVRVADRPLQYAVEDYAVIFSLRADATFVPQRAERAVGLAPLAVRTFHVDTNTFVAGMESAFGIKVETKGKGDSQSRKIQSALKELLVQLNVAIEGNKAIFYNELTGTVMVRVAVDDVDVIQAAIETLGGQPTGSYAASYGPGGVPPPGYGRR